MRLIIEVKHTSKTRK